MSEPYDVIVVGGGPAGGTAAYFLGEAGYRVLVLEKETLPRYKTCGGGLSTDFLNRFFPFSFDAVPEKYINAFSYSFNGRDVIVPVEPGNVGMVMRDRLDAFILSQAKADVFQGAAARKVFESADRVVVETADGRRFTGKYLIGADGANSVVARSLGLRNSRILVAAVEAEAPVSPDVMRRFGDRITFIFGEIRLGYLWIFPKADHLSVGIAAFRPGRGELQSTLRRVMKGYGISLEGIQLHGHPIPVYTRRQPISTVRTLLVGDAAGLVNPLSGEGIRYAIKSGRLAADAILSGQPERYSQLVARQIGLEHMATLWIAEIFYRFQRLCLALGAPNPFTTRAIVDLLSDRATAVDVFLAGVLTLPVYWLIEALGKIARRLGGQKYIEPLRSMLYPQSDRGQPAR